MLKMAAQNAATELADIRHDKGRAELGPGDKVRGFGVVDHSAVEMKKRR